MTECSSFGVFFAKRAQKDLIRTFFAGGCHFLTLWLSYLSGTDAQNGCRRMPRLVPGLLAGACGGALGGGALGGTSGIPVPKPTLFWHHPLE